MRHRALRVLLLFVPTLCSVQAVGQTLPAKARNFTGTTQPHSDSSRKPSSFTEKLTAYSIAIPPHGSTEMTSHPYDYLVVSLSAVELEAIGSSGNSYKIQLEQEEMQVMKGGWAHRLTNPSDKLARLIEIDVQPNIAPEHALCGLAASPCTDGQFGRNSAGTYATSTLFETPKVKLSKIELGVGAVFDRHVHRGSEMLIPLTRVHLSDSSQLDFEKDVGEVQAYSKATIHALKNLGSEPVRFLELEVK